MDTDTLTVYTYRKEGPEGTTHYLGLLSPEQVTARGAVPPEAILGALLRPPAPGQPISPDSFAQNRAFVDFLHGIIARRGPTVPALVAEAQKQGEGWVYIIDQRTPRPDEQVPPEDIVGAFEVHNGVVVANSYRRGEKHVLLSSNGIFKLGAALQRFLIEELSLLGVNRPALLS